MFEVYLANNRAKKEYEDLEDNMRIRVNELFEKLRLVPVPFREYDIIKVQGRNGVYRIRLGGFRIIYLVDELSHSICTLTISRRSETTYK